MVTNPYVLLEDALIGILQIVPLIVDKSSVVSSGAIPPNKAGTNNTTAAAATNTTQPTWSHNRKDSASMATPPPRPGAMRTETITNTSSPPSPLYTRARTTSTGSNSNSTISATRYQLATTMLQPPEFPLSEDVPSSSSATPAASAGDETTSPQSPPFPHTAALSEPSLSSLSKTANMEGTSPEQPTMAQSSRILVDKLMSLSSSFTRAIKMLCEQQHERVLRFDDDVILELLLKWEQGAGGDGEDGGGDNKHDDPESDNHSTTSLITLDATNALERYQITVGRVWEETEIIRSCIRKIREIVEFGHVQSEANDFDEGDSEEDVLKRDNHVRKTIYSTLLFHTNALVTVLGEYLECISSIQRLFGTIRGPNKSTDAGAPSNQGTMAEHHQQHSQQSSSHTPTNTATTTPVSDIMLVNEPRPIRHLDPALTRRLQRKTRFKTLTDKMRHQFSQFTKRSTDTLLAIFPPLGDGMNDGSLYWDSDEDYGVHWESDDGYHMGVSTTMTSTTATDRYESIYSGGEDTESYSPSPLSPLAHVAATATTCPSSPSSKSELVNTSAASVLAAAVGKRRPQFHRRISSKGSDSMPEQYWPGSQPLHSSDHGNWSDSSHSRLTSPDLYAGNGSSGSGHTSPSRQAMVNIGGDHYATGMGGGGGGEHGHGSMAWLSSLAGTRKSSKRHSGESSSVHEENHKSPLALSHGPPQLNPLRTGPEDRARQSLLFRRRGSWQPKQAPITAACISAPLPNLSNRNSGMSFGSDPLTPTKNNYKAAPPPPPSEASTRHDPDHEHDNPRPSDVGSEGSTDMSRSKTFSYLAVRTGTPQLQGPLILDSPFTRQTSIRMAHDRNRYSIRMPNEILGEDGSSSSSSSLQSSSLSLSSSSDFRKRSSTTSSASSSSSSAFSSGSSSSSPFWRRRSFNDALEKSWNALTSEGMNSRLLQQNHHHHGTQWRNSISSNSNSNSNGHNTPMLESSETMGSALTTSGTDQSPSQGKSNNGSSGSSDGMMTNQGPVTHDRHHHHHHRHHPSVRLSTFDFVLPIVAPNHESEAGHKAAGADSHQHLQRRPSSASHGSLEEKSRRRHSSPLAVSSLGSIVRRKGSHRSTVSTGTVKAIPVGGSSGYSSGGNSGSSSHRTSLHAMPTVTEHQAVNIPQHSGEDYTELGITRHEEERHDGALYSHDHHYYHHHHQEQEEGVGGEKHGDIIEEKRPPLPTQAEVLLDQQESIDYAGPFALPASDPTVIETQPRLIPGKPRQHGGDSPQAIPPRPAPRLISNGRFQDMKRAENGVDVMVLEAIEGRLQVVAGRLEKLVERLADESTQDSEYVSYFILSHSFFIESEDFLDALIARFHIQPRQGELLYFQKWQAIIQVKVLCVIERWIQLQYEDFELNANLLKTLKRFLEHDVRMAGYVIEAECIEQSISIKSLSSLKNCSIIMEQGRFCLQRTRTRKISLSRSQKQSQNGSASGSPTMLLADNESSPLSPSTSSSASTAPTPATSPPKTIQKIEFGPTPELSVDSPILDLDTRDLARYLTLADMSAFRSITVFELMSGWWKRRQATEAAAQNGAGGAEEVSEDFKMLKLNFNVDSVGDGAIEAFTRRANMLSYWVAHEIVSVAGTKTRKHLIKKFIEVAKLVSARDMETLKSLEHLLDPSGNMKHYRQAMDAAEPPTIPFLPILLKDITFILDGNPTKIMSRGSNHHHNSRHPNTGQSGANNPNSTATNSNKHDSRPGCGSELINFDKFRRLAQYVEQAVDMARLGSYSFEHQLLRQARVFKPSSSPSTAEDPTKPANGGYDAAHQSQHSPVSPHNHHHHQSQHSSPSHPSFSASLSSASAAKLFFKSLKESASGGGASGSGHSSMHRHKMTSDSATTTSSSSSSSQGTPTTSTLGDVKGVLDPISELVETRLVKASGLYGVHQRVIQVEFVTRAKGSSGLWKPLHGLGSPSAMSPSSAGSSSSFSTLHGSGGSGGSGSAHSTPATATAATSSNGTGASGMMSGGMNSSSGSGHGGYRVIRTVQGEEDYLMGLSFMCEPGR
ncbi:hypothetical protein BGW41_002989 [Actinomortierella wolfii]|nr:hypothetical protein BGW41_002989 [Actinomortierella wolfii]